LVDCLAFHHDHAKARIVKRKVCYPLTRLLCQG
jgi:hypothetical protein